MPTVSQREIAEHAGVSVSAVSLALRNHPKVSTEVRARIQQIARALGYRADPRISELMGHLRTARAQRSPSKIAVIVPDQTPAEFAEHAAIRATIAGARELAEEAGFALDLFFLGEPGMSTSRLRGILEARGIHGVFVAPFAHHAGRLDFDFTGFASATAGYSVVEPALHRSCPNHLQMLEQLFAWIRGQDYCRPGLVVGAERDCTEHRFALSAFLYFQQQLPATARVPILTQPEISDFNLLSWIRSNRPDLVIGSSTISAQFQRLGLHEAGDAVFATLDLTEPTEDVAGLAHHRRVGRESIKLILSQLMLNQTGVPEHPKTVLVDSVWRPNGPLLTHGITRAG